VLSSKESKLARRREEDIKSQFQQKLFTLWKTFNYPAAEKELRKAVKIAAGESQNSCMASPVSVFFHTQGN
jgi:hypothetical protein